MNSSTPSAAGAPPTLLVDARTHVGRVRARNEDALAINAWNCGGARDAHEQWAFERGEPVHLVLADGMGGHRCGDVASQMVVQRMSGLDGQDPAHTNLDGLRAAARATHAAVLSAGRERAECAGMGATLAGALVRRGEALFYNVGDSRVYLYRARELRQLSTDDRAGAYWLTQAVGGRPGGGEAALRVHAGCTGLCAGDRLLLCSDGLTDVVPDELIGQSMQHSPPDCTEALVQYALGAGGPDNISVVLAVVG